MIGRGGSAILGPDDHRLALYSDEPLFKARLSSVFLRLG